MSQMPFRGPSGSMEILTSLSSSLELSIASCQHSYLSPNTRWAQRTWRHGCDHCFCRWLAVSHISNTSL